MNERRAKLMRRLARAVVAHASDLDVACRMADEFERQHRLNRAEWKRALELEIADRHKRSSS